MLYLCISKDITVPTLSEENYLKAIWKLVESTGDAVSTNAIAAEVNTKAASVTDMLRKLSDKKLIHYKKYQGVTLTEKGRKLALNTVRKHRLWKVFLVEKLDFRWDEVHEIAEQLEHINSSSLTERLDKFLGYPKTDPHGDPIPDSEGNIEVTAHVLLNTVEAGKTVIMTGVSEHSTSFLRYLDEAGMGLGTTITVESYVEFDRSVNILINNKKKLHISENVAANLLVRKNNKRNGK
ncbi:MAG: metal-dependent transcriptional regulator [Bacteroidia bacterium]